MLKVRYEPGRVALPRKRLGDIGNGTFFLGTVDGYVSAGPFLKTGSLSQEVWVVVKLENMGGGVWVSGRDEHVFIDSYRALFVAEVVLREQATAVDAGASPVGEGVTESARKHS